MLAINREKMGAAGFDFADLAEAKNYCDSLIDYLYTHNKNFTKEQWRKIIILQEIAAFIEEV